MPTTLQPAYAETLTFDATDIDDVLFLPVGHSDFDPEDDDDDSDSGDGWSDPDDDAEATGEFPIVPVAPARGSATWPYPAGWLTARQQDAADDLLMIFAVDGRHSRPPEFAPQRAEVWVPDTPAECRVWLAGTGWEQLPLFRTVLRRGTNISLEHHSLIGVET